MSYRVFVRNFWTANPAYPDGREPRPGRKTTIVRRVETEDEACGICKQYNATHAPGALSRKAEYEEN
jgi:hypothetical protein